jgi:hypothetical protein
VAATSATAGAPVSQEGGGEDEKAGGRIDISGVTGRDGPLVRGEDLGAIRPIGGQAVGVRHVEITSGHRRSLVGSSGGRPVRLARHVVVRTGHRPIMLRLGRSATAAPHLGRSAPTRPRGLPGTDRMRHHVAMGDLLPLVFLLDLGFMVAALYDCITTDASQVRNLPKLGWIAVILILSGIGGVLWFIAGRPDSNAMLAPHPGHPAGRGLRGSERDDIVSDRIVGDRIVGDRPRAPDDDPDFLQSLSDRTRRAEEERLRRWEADLRLREERLRRQEERPEDQH